MNEQNQAIVSEDLAAQDTEEIKLEASVAGSGLDDLEPQADVVGGQTREHILLARQVG